MPMEPVLLVPDAAEGACAVVECDGVIAEEVCEVGAADKVNALERRQ
jgi:hypothetical protein